MRRNPESLSDLVKWPDSMWPFTPSFLSNLPKELLPDLSSLAELQNPWELLTLLAAVLKERLTRDKISNTAEVMENVIIRSPVWIEEGVTIHPFSVIVGPAYLGAHTMVGNFTQIRESIIGSNCLIGERVSIVRSIAGQGSSFHMNYVGDSLLDREVHMGGSTRTANTSLRRNSIKSTIAGIRQDTGLHRLGALIGPHVRFASDCLTMPGVKIGKGSILGPRVLLTEDLPVNSRCRVVQTLQILSGGHNAGST